MGKAAIGLQASGLPGVFFALVVTAIGSSIQLEAQVDISPRSIEPAQWERIAVRVASRGESPTVVVRVYVPEVIAVIGVEARPGWVFQNSGATDSTPQSIEWTGGEIQSGEFAEFAFLGRLAADVRRKNLIFPVTLVSGDGSAVEFGRGRKRRAPPTMFIAGSTRVTPWATIAAAGVAVGISLLTLALVVSKRGAAA